MNSSIKKTIVLVIMLIVMLSVASFASSRQLSKTVITFADGNILSFATSKELSPKEILEEKQISLLNDEVIHYVKKDNTLNIYITKKETIAKSYVSEETQNVESNYLNGMLEEKIEKTIIDIPFKTIKKNNFDSNISSTRIDREGKSGKKEITFKSIYSQGNLISKVEIASKVLEMPVDKIIVVGSRPVSISNSKGYSKSQIDMLYAITAQECSSSYDGALAVISTAINRSKSARWKKYGKDPLSQYMAKGQFSAYGSGAYKKRYGKIPQHVKNAVNDALNGKTNHSYLSFRSSSYAKSHGITGKNIGGNIYFNKM